MRSLLLIILGLLLNNFAQATNIQLKETLDCLYKAGTEGELTKNLEWKTKTTNSSEMKVTFSNMSGKNPIVVGNTGSSELVKIAGSKGVLYAIEMTEKRNLILWTFWEHEGRLFSSLKKQYNFFGPLSLEKYGTCRWRG